MQVPSGVRAPAALPEPGHPQLPALQDHVQGWAEQDQAPHQDKVRDHHSVLSEYGQYGPVESSEYWFSLFLDKMEPPRQDQAPHQDKVRAPPFRQYPKMTMV